MRSTHIVATIILTLSCALFGASCIQDPTAPLDTGLNEPQSSNATDPIGEAQEPLPVVHFRASAFPFVTTIPDDGEGDGGGWQVASATLDFWKVVIPHTSRRWECTLVIEMPLRTRYMGRIPASRAATLSVEIAEAAARTMDYDLPSTSFCKELVDGMKGLFATKYPKLGARVKPR